MRFAIAVVAIGACGRIHFGEIGASGDDAGGDGRAAVDAPPSTGPAGTRYLIALDSNAAPPVIAGAQGKVAVAENFQGATTIAGHAFTGQAMFESGALAWFDNTGVVTTTSVLDSTSICQIRGLGSTPTGVVTIGYTQAGATMPGYGPCAIATAHQDGIAIAIDPEGGQKLGGHAASQSANAQGWYATGFADGSIAFSGIYADAGTKIAGTVLPVAGSDENAYFARIDTTGSARWIATVVSADEIFAGPMDARGDDLCITGAFVNTVTVLGTPMTAIGMADSWVARVDPSGNPRWVRAYGSTGTDSTTAGISVAAMSDGGCVVATIAPNDVTLDSGVSPASAGGSIVVRFDALGKEVAGARAPAGLVIGRIGDQIYGAVACTQACTIGGTAYTPTGKDIVLAAFDSALHAKVIGALGGGATVFDRFAAIDPDTLAVSFQASGPTTFGAEIFTPPGVVNALAVFGI